jgi:dihydropyrimidinase
MRLNVDELRAVLKKSKELGTIVTAHCEMGEEVERSVANLIAQDKLAPRFHRLSRPAEVEGRATEHFLALAAAENSAAYVVHMSCRESVSALAAAKERGQECYGETCIQYLLLDSSLYEQSFEQASRYILSPPLRPKEHQATLWSALANGILDVVATDHCPFTTAQRQRGRDDFSKIPNGIGGLEERVILLFSEGVKQGRLTPQRFVEVMATNPAKRFGLYPQKGTLQVGSDADLIILDPDAKWTLTNDQLHHSCDYSCYEGWKVQGKIEQVYAAGKKVW